LNSEKRVYRKFDPANPKYRWKLSLKLETPQGKIRYWFWPRILSLAGVLALSGLWAANLAVWFNARYRHGATEVHYLDVALPWRWSRYRAELSRYNVRMGQAAGERDGGERALTFYEQALSFDRTNLDAERLAAAARYELGQKSAALAGLASGLGRAAAQHDERYLSLFFSLAFQSGAEELAAHAGQALMPAAPRADSFDQRLAFLVAAASFRLGRYADASRIIREWNLRNQPDGALLWVQVLWESGRTQTATVVMRDVAARFSARDPFNVVLEQIARGTNDPVQVLRYAQTRAASLPASFAPQIDLLYAWHELGRQEAEAAALAKFFQNFRANPAAMARLAQFAFETKQPALAEKIERAAADQHWPTAAYELAWAEAQVTAHDPLAALTTIARLRTEHPDLSPPVTALVAGLELVAKGEEGEDANVPGLFVLRADRLKQLDSAAALRIAGYLHDLNQEQVRGLLLEPIWEADPNNGVILAELVEADMAAHNRPKFLLHLAARLQLPKPPRALLDRALAMLTQPEDHALREQVDVAIATHAATYLPTPRTPVQGADS
jgi:hypothetical protein